MKKYILLLICLFILLSACTTNPKPTATSTVAVATTTPTLPPAPTATSTSTPQPSTVPQLEYPPEGEVMDNGRGDTKDNMAWYFDWSDVPGATRYYLFVIHNSAAQPVIDAMVTHSSYYDDRPSLGLTSVLSGWTWRVRAEVDGSWSDWSEVRTFKVEEIGSDPAVFCTPWCDQAVLPIATTFPPPTLSIALPSSLTTNEYPLASDSELIHNQFKPVGISREEILSLHRAEREKSFPDTLIRDTIDNPESMILAHHTILFQGRELVAEEMMADDDKGQQRWGQVRRGNQVLFTVPPEPYYADILFRSFWQNGIDWFLEIAHGVTVEPQACILRDVIQSGVSLSEKYGYDEAFGFQLLHGEPFYFFRRGNHTGIEYAGQATWLGYDEIPHNPEVYGGAVSPPLHSENMVSFFARRDGTWYYVEIGLFNE